MGGARRVAVVDASPCIALARIGQQDLLSQVFESILIPDSVVTELWNGRQLDDAWTIVRRSGIEVRAVGVPRVLDPPASLSPADRDVIELALDESADFVVMDERLARRSAAGAGLRVIGTVGVIAAAVRRGTLGCAGPSLAALMESGFRLESSLVDRVLAGLGEGPLHER